MKDLVNFYFKFQNFILPMVLGVILYGTPLFYKIPLCKTDSDEMIIKNEYG